MKYQASYGRDCTNFMCISQLGIALWEMFALCSRSPSRSYSSLARSGRLYTEVSVRLMSEVCADDFVVVFRVDAEAAFDGPWIAEIAFLDMIHRPHPECYMLTMIGCRRVPMCTF